MASRLSVGPALRAVSRNTRAQASPRIRRSRARQPARPLTAAGSFTPVPPSLLPASPASRYLSTSSPRRATARLTVDTYPDLVRDSRFARLTDEHVSHFKRVLGDAGILDATTEDLEPFNTDWMRKYRGQARLVLKPESTEQVSEVLRYCNQHMLAVVPQGGNTSLVGGSVPVFDEIVVNLGRMNQIYSFDEVSGDFVLGAGCILETAERFLNERGHTFPLDLGAKGSCQVGGNVSTNAGGLRLLRYGNLHGSILGIEAVLADGTVVDDLCTLRKNNTGYDIKQLFVGAEGTLGIVTKVSVQCAQRSAAVNVAFLGLRSFEHARDAFREAKSRLGEILSAFEMMDAESQRLVARARPSVPRPLEDTSHEFYCLVETRGSDGEHDYAKLERFLEDVLGREVVADGVVAQDETQTRSLWAWREAVPECVGHWGGVYKYDVSVPLADMYRLVEDTRVRLEKAGLVWDGGDSDAADGDRGERYPVISTVGYGHMGDSNLHLNVATRQYDARVERVLEPWVFEWIAARGGSISAEHGLGLAKKKAIRYSRNATTIGLMKRIKDLFDPKGIMNPYKFI